MTGVVRRALSREPSMFIPMSTATSKMARAISAATKATGVRLTPATGSAPNIPMVPTTITRLTPNRSMNRPTRALPTRPPIDDPVRTRPSVAMSIDSRSRISGSRGTIEA